MIEITAKEVNPVYLSRPKPKKRWVLLAVVLLLALSAMLMFVALYQWHQTSKLIEQDSQQTISPKYYLQTETF